MDKPEAERIYIPTKRFGSVYDGQWVERRREYDHQLGLWAFHVTTAPLYRNHVSAKLNLIATEIFTDWNLSGHEGPLPKPWQNAKAFEALMNTDLTLWIWLLQLAAQPIGYEMNGIKENHG